MILSTSGSCNIVHCNYRNTYIHSVHGVVTVTQHHHHHYSNTIYCIFHANKMHVIICIILVIVCVNAQITLHGGDLDIDVSTAGIFNTRINNVNVTGSHAGGYYYTLLGETMPVSTINYCDNPGFESTETVDSVVKATGMYACVCWCCYAHTMIHIVFNRQLL